MSQCLVRSRQVEAGFSLLELMIALCLLAVGVLGLARVFAISSRTAVLAKTETTAISLAREIEEKILSESVAQVATMFDGVDTADAGTVTLPCETWAGHLSAELGPTGRGRITVRNSTQDPDILDGMLSIEVVVSWMANGDTLAVPLSFCVTDIGS